MFVCNSLQFCTAVPYTYKVTFNAFGITIKSLTFMKAATLGKNFKISEPIATYVVLDDVFT